MTDYYTLIAQAVRDLDQSTGWTRRALYERARATQLRELRAIRPPIAELAIAKERLSLESAISKVEADAARKSGAKPRETRSDVAPLLPRAAGVDSDSSEQVRPRKGRATIVIETEPARPPAVRLLRWLSGKRAPSFGNAVSEVQRLDAVGKSRERRAGPTPSPARLPAEGTTSRSSGDVKSGDTEDLSTAHDEELRATGSDPSDNFDEDQEALNAEQHLLQATEDEHLQPLPPRSYPKLIRSVIALLMLASLAAAISWQWRHISELYRSVSQIEARRQPGQAAPQTASQSKFLDRVPQDQGTAQAPATQMPDNQASPTAAQRVVLYQEDSSDSQGKRYFGLVTWRTETVSPAPSSASELAVRADVKIPERRTTMTWLLRRNLDHALSASHTIEIMFNLPSEFAAGGVASVPGIMMKQSEEVPGTPLIKLAVKATNGAFMIDLSAAAADLQRNVQLLKESQWLDIPIVYVDGTRAIMAIEKGPPGDRAIAEAFAAWEKK